MLSADVGSVETTGPDHDSFFDVLPEVEQSPSCSTKASAIGMSAWNLTFASEITFHTLGLVPGLPASQGGCECISNLILTPGLCQLLLYLLVACSLGQVQPAH